MASMGLAAREAYSACTFPLQMVDLLIRPVCNTCKFQHDCSLVSSLYKVLDWVQSLSEFAGKTVLVTFRSQGINTF